MILEVIATAFIAVYIGLVIFGHGLLFIAILKCLGESGGRRWRSKTDERSRTDVIETPAQAASARSGVLA